MHPGRSLILVTATILIAAVVLGGCSASGPALEMAGEPGSGGEAQPAIRANTPWILDIPGMLCLSEPGQVTITAVAIHPGVGLPLGGLRVEAFATRPSPFIRGGMGLSTLQTTLAAYGHGFVPGGPQVAVAAPGTTCPTAADAYLWRGGTELGLQVSKDQPGLAGGAGVDVTYRSAGVSHTLLIPFAIVLCPQTGPNADCGPPFFGAGSFSPSAP